MHAAPVVAISGQVRRGHPTASIPYSSNLSTFHPPILGSRMFRFSKQTEEAVPVLALARSSSSRKMSRWAMLPDEAWEHVFSFLTANCDRNAVPLVCRGWYHIERRSRRTIFIANCYAVIPAATVGRFTGVRTAYIKGKSRHAASIIFPREWDCGAESWVAAMAKGWPQLEEVHLKHMVINDDCLQLIAQSFKNLRVLALSKCDGVTTKGLAAIAANCRNLMKLDLPNTKIERNYANWLSCFPKSFTSLVDLSHAYSLNEEFIIPIMELLVSRCTNIQTLRLSDTMPLGSLINILHSAPQLAKLGIPFFSANYDPELFANLESAFANCRGLKSLYLYLNVDRRYLPTIYSLWDGLTSLLLCNCLIIGRHDLIKLVSRCKNLQRLWVGNNIGNDGLATVASSCKLLQELRIFPLLYDCQEPYSLTEFGLVTVSAGCPMLEYVFYLCDKMTNAALIAVARHRPNLKCFRLSLKPHTPDYVTRKPLDAGFSAIVESCKDLRRLSLTGLLTDDVFRSIGASANRLEKLSVDYAGESDLGLHYILSGCKSLQKLDVENCPFGDRALTSNAAKLQKMRYLWMSSCPVRFGPCRSLAHAMPWLNVEVTIEEAPSNSRFDDLAVKKLYVYGTTVAGPISDMPTSVPGQ